MLTLLTKIVSYIYDLQGETSQEFSSELAEWAPSEVSTLTISSVSSYPFVLMSASSSYTEVQRTYSDLDDHEYIAFSVCIIIYGSYTGDIFEMSFDNTTLTPLVASSLSFSTGQELYIKGGVTHSGSSLQVKITSLLSSDSTLSLGVRELNMNFYQTSSSYTNVFCHALIGNSQLTPVCGCAIDKNGPSTNCEPCDSGCLYCGQSNSQNICSKCDTDDFYEWNGSSCSSDCASYCEQCSGLAGDSCSACLTELYQYSNGTCLEQCPSPFISNNTGPVSTCSAPCDSSSEWLYPDLSCGGSCDSPLVSETDQYEVRWCVTPCSDDELLYSNGICGTECSGETFVEDNVKGIDYCENVCGANDTYIFRNETCVVSCSSPNKLKSESLGDFCESPCDDPDDYYYEEAGSCEDSCEYPNVKDESGLTKICSTGLDSSTIESTKQAAKAVNSVNSASSWAITVLNFLSSSDSTSICMGAFSKMLQYVKYMDIAYPAKVVFMLENLSSNSSSFVSKMMKGVLEKFPNRQLPAKFEYYGAISSFFVNFWPSLFILLVILLLTIVSLFLSSCFRSSQTLKTVTGILKWNMILLMFCGDFGDLVLFSALELTTEKFDSLGACISMALCLIINFISVWVLLKILTVTSSLWKYKQQEQNLMDLEVRWGSYKTFFVTYKDQFYSQQIFLFFFIIRVSVFNGVIGYLYEYPLLQAILITLTNFIMLGYLMFRRPMKMLINLIQQLILEGFLLVFNICICILAGLDASGIQAYYFRDSIGEAIVIINAIVPVVSIVVLLAKLVILGVTAYQNWKSARKERTGFGGIRAGKLSFGSFGKPVVVNKRRGISQRKEIEKKVETKIVLDLSHNNDSSFQAFVHNGSAMIVKDHLHQRKMNQIGGPSKNLMLNLVMIFSRKENSKTEPCESGFEHVF